MKRLFVFLLAEYIMTSKGLAVDFVELSFFDFYHSTISTSGIFLKIEVAKNIILYSSIQIIHLVF